MNNTPVKNPQKVIDALELAFCVNCDEYYNQGGDSAPRCCDVDLSECEVKTCIDTISEGMEDVTKCEKP